MDTLPVELRTKIARLIRPSPPNFFTISDDIKSCLLLPLAQVSCSWRSVALDTLFEQEIYILDQSNSRFERFLDMYEKHFRACHVLRLSCWGRDNGEQEDGIQKRHRLNKRILERLGQAVCQLELSLFCDNQHSTIHLDELLQYFRGSVLSLKRYNDASVSPVTIIPPKNFSVPTLHLDPSLNGLPCEFLSSFSCQELVYGSDRVTLPIALLQNLESLILFDHFPSYYKSLFSCQNGFSRPPPLQYLDLSRAQLCTFMSETKKANLFRGVDSRALKGVKIAHTHLDLDLGPLLAHVPCLLVHFRGVPTTPWKRVYHKQVCALLRLPELLRLELGVLSYGGDHDTLRGANGTWLEDLRANLPPERKSLEILLVDSSTLLLRGGISSPFFLAQ